jgi:hypothetical protein
MLVYDGTGLVLIWKRLEGAKFKWPAISDGVMRLSAAQAGLGPVGLQEGLALRSCRHALLGFGDISQGIAHPMHTAALPGSDKHLADRRFEPFMSVGDDQLDAAQPAPRQPLRIPDQKVSASDGRRQLAQDLH